MARDARSRTSLAYLVILALAALAVGTGCRFDPNPLSGDPGAQPDAMDVPVDAPPPGDAPPPVDAPPIDAGPAPDAEPTPDAAPLPPPDVLVDRDVITRYFIDESTDGTSPTLLIDATPNPLQLNINYDVGGEFIDDGGNRGLRWNVIPENGRAVADLAESSKVWRELDGSTTGTIEMVVRVEEFVDGSRLSHIGEGDDSGVFTLRIDEPESFALAWNNEVGGRVGWAADVQGVGRAVVHAVFDSGHADPEQRVRLYVNGAPLARTSGAPPELDEVIDIVSGSSTAYLLGNTEAGDRGVQATFYYASLYSAALDQGEVMHNATILIANDDGPGSTLAGGADCDAASGALTRRSLLLEPRRGDCRPSVR